MQKVLSSVRVRVRETLHIIFSTLAPGVIGIAKTFLIFYTHAGRKRSVSLPLKKKPWPESGTTGLNSCCRPNQLLNLANTHTLFHFLLTLFSLVECITSRPSHLKDTLSPVSSRKKFLPSSGLPCFLPALSSPTLSTHTPTSVVSSELLDGQSQTAKALEGVPLSKVSIPPSATDSFFSLQPLHPTGF